MDETANSSIKTDAKITYQNISIRILKPNSVLINTFVETRIEQQIEIRTYIGIFQNADICTIFIVQNKNKCEVLLSTKYVHFTSCTKSNIRKYFIIRIFGP
jgi:hypothetical protein